jgi:hypothetical protein
LTPAGRTAAIAVRKAAGTMLPMLSATRRVSFWLTSPSDRFLQAYAVVYNEDFQRKGGSVKSTIDISQTRSSNGAPARSAHCSSF